LHPWNGSSLAFELLGPVTWRLPRRLDAHLPHVNIEGSTSRALPGPEAITPKETITA
jgi:hypothetical protein